MINLLTGLIGITVWILCFIGGIAVGLGIIFWKYRERNATGGKNGKTKSINAR